MSRSRYTEEQAALLEILEPSGAPQWAQASDIDGWSLRAAAKAIAHDLREPILGIRRLAGWLADLAAEDEREESERYRALLDERLERLEQRYDALRRFIDAGLVVGETELLDIGELCQAAATSAALATGREVEVATSTATTTQITTSRRLLERCLGELVSNCLVHHDSQRVAIQVQVTQCSGARRIEIIDDGPGIAADERERVFEPFFGKADCAGMGLAIVRRTAALRGGWCEHVAHAHGSRAILTWPD